jgi:hypothetical protein
MKRGYQMAKTMKAAVVRLLPFDGGYLASKLTEKGIGR